MKTELTALKVRPALLGKNFANAINSLHGSE